jgi:ATP-dependent Lhr-like helicase
MGPALSGDERANRLAQIALARHGVVTQELLGRIESRVVAGEELPWEWSELYGQLQRMELRGEVRRGYFIAGLSGVQYALPEAVERLRAARTSEDDALTVLAACDPANVYGGENLTPGPSPARSGEPDTPFPGREGGLGDRSRFARVPSTHCVFWRGRPVLTAEDNGMRLTVAADVEAEIIARALAAYLNRPAAPRRLTVEQWNAAPVLGSAGEPLLKALAFSRTPSGMERWADR